MCVCVCVCVCVCAFFCVCVCVCLPNASTVYRHIAADVPVHRQCYLHSAEGSVSKGYDSLWITVMIRDARFVAIENDRPSWHCYYSVGARTKERKL